MSKADEIAQKIYELGIQWGKLSDQKKEIDRQIDAIRHVNAALHDQLAAAKLESYGLSVGDYVAITAECLDVIYARPMKPEVQVGDVFTIENVIRNTVMLANGDDNIASFPLEDAGKLQKVVSE